MSTSKDDWDASSEEEPPVVETKPATAPGVKDDWDASSEEEKAPVQPPPKVEEPAKRAPSKRVFLLL